MQDKKVLMIRILLIVFCAVMALTCLQKIHETYDPLARYPYATEENRKTILEHLDQKGVDYIITQQIKPNQFLDFIDEPEFSIYNTLYYAQAKKIQDAPNAFIINFVNKYRSHFNLDTLKTLLKHYSYADLTSFYENEQVLHENIQLIADPSYPYLVLDQDRSVYRYVPSELVEQEGVSIKQTMQKNLKAMCSDYEKLKNQEDHLKVIEGYTSYAQVLEAYYTYSSQLGDYIDRFIYSAGENEMQLGYSIRLEPSIKWNATMIEQKLFLDNDYAKAQEQLDDNEIDQLNWLKSNAWRYGFIIRYPGGKEELTGHWYQPFLLRYVGKENAKIMFEEGQVMETMKFSEEN